MAHVSASVLICLNGVPPKSVYNTTFIVDDRQTIGEVKVEAAKRVSEFVEDNKAIRSALIIQFRINDTDNA